MKYILIFIEGYGNAYQECANGYVNRYLSTDGVELFNVVPTGQGSWVLDDNPPHLSWMA